MRINACAALVSATRIRPVSPEAVAIQVHAIRVSTSTNAPMALTPVVRRAKTSDARMWSPPVRTGIPYTLVTLAAIPVAPLLSRLTPRVVYVGEAYPTPAMLSAMI